MPRSKGVYFFGSQVSVDACPPAIHKSTIQSAVGSSFLGSSAARRPGPSTAAVPTAQPARRKSRREIDDCLESTSRIMFSPHKLKLRADKQRPEKIFQTFLSSRR